MNTFKMLNSVPSIEQVPKCFLVLLLSDTAHLSSSASKAVSLLRSTYISQTKRMRNAVLLPFHGSWYREQLASGITGVLDYPACGPRRWGLGVGDKQSSGKIRATTQLPASLASLFCWGRSLCGRGD